MLHVLSSKEQKSGQAARKLEIDTERIDKMKLLETETSNIETRKYLVASSVLFHGTNLSRLQP